MQLNVRDTNDRNKRRPAKLPMWISYLLMGFGLCLITAAFCVPPLGVIDSSVLIAFGELLTFTATILGLDYKHRS